MHKHCSVQLTIIATVLFCFTNDIYAQEIIETTITVKQTSSAATKIQAYNQDIPRSIESVNANILQAHASTKVDESLSYSSGILTSIYGKDRLDEWFSIRGFEAKMYQDFSPVIKLDGYYGWHTEVFGLESLEALKGPSSLLYGNSLPGGVVNVTTKKPTGKKASILQMAIGTDNYKHLGFDTQNKKENIAYRLVSIVKGSQMDDAKQARTERYYFAPSVAIDINDKTYLSLRSTIMKDNTSKLSSFKFPYGTLHGTPYGKVKPSVSFGEPSYNKNDSQQYSFGWEFGELLNNNWQFIHNLNYSHLDLLLHEAYAYSQDFNDPRYVNRGLVYRDGSAKSLNTDNRLIGRFLTKTLESTILVGVDYTDSRSSGKNDTTVWGDWFGEPLNMFDPVYNNYMEITDDKLVVSKNKQEQLGLYSQYSARLGNLISSIGIRFDKFKQADTKAENTVDSNGDAVTKSLGLIYQFKNIAPYINYAQSFEILAGRDAHENTYKPKEGEQVEAGVKYTLNNNKGYINFSSYQIVEKNSLQTDPNEPSAQYQVGEQEAKGVELEAKVMVLPELMLQSSLTNAKKQVKYDLNKDMIGKEIVMTPNWTLSTWLLYSFNKSANKQVGFGARYVGEAFGDANNTREMIVPNYTVFDAMFNTGILKNLDLQLNIKNIANKEYVSACNYYCYYGNSREAILSATYKY